MFVYLFCNSQFARVIWASISSLFATLSAYALYILILLLGIALILGAVNSRSIGKTTKGFTNVLMGIIKAVIMFIAVKCIWKVIRWIVKQIKKLWSWIQKKLQKGFQKYVDAGPAKVLGNIFATLIIIAGMLII